MRCLLVTPVHLYKWVYPAYVSLPQFPTGPAYIAASLRQAGHDVHVCNPNNKPEYTTAKDMLQRQLTHSIQQVNPEVIFVGGICTDYASIKDTITHVRQQVPNTPVILGGGLATHDSQFIFDRLQPDTLIVGEADHAVLDVLSHQRTGIVRAEVPKQLDALPWPAWDLFDTECMINASDHAFALYRFPVQSPRSFVVVASRSCPFHCTFCVHQQFSSYRRRQLLAVVEEIRHWQRKYDANLFVIQDELFAPTDAMLKEFSTLMLPLGVNWAFQTHCSAQYSVQTLQLAREAGLYFFAYGVESASLRVLSSMQKRSDPLKVRQGCRAAAAASVGFGGNFIFGDPVETAATVAETFNFFNQEMREGNSVWLAGIQPYPGSKLFADAFTTVETKVDFYERIDEQRFCLTPFFPKHWWLLWLSILSYLGGRKLWLRVAKNNQCPYCSRIISSTPMTVDGGLRKCQCLSNIWQFVRYFKNSWAFMFCLYIFIIGVSIVFPWFKHLTSLISLDPRKLNSKEWGCSHCNKMFLVKI